MTGLGGLGEGGWPFQARSLCRNHTLSNAQGGEDTSNSGFDDSPAESETAGRPGPGVDRRLDAGSGLTEPGQDS